MGLSEDEHRAADIELRRAEIELRKRELESARKRALWDGLASFAAAFVPLATLFGLQAYLGRKKS